MATTCICIIKLARVPFPFNLSNPPILGAPGGDCLQLPGPKTESFHAFTVENKWIFPFCSYEFLCVQPMLTNASSPATADKKHDEASVPRSPRICLYLGCKILEKIHHYMGKGRDIVLRVDIQRAATKRQPLCSPILLDVAPQCRGSLSY
ncbi:unnamed protein product [Miscanthus lutarioriparius]|uniref:Uncharacterized protein n=1 Tax=Miscanthus lutarioriparius TaxID=422564 RepID=A0A811NLI8_9POAL|nr:unnamed protein product [Miscanthus lutarioriparius]